MLDDQYTRRQFTTVLCIVVPLLLLFGLSNFGRRASSGASSPFMAICQNVKHNVASIWNVLSGKEDEKAEADAILLGELLAKQREFDSVKDENRQLRAMLGVEAPTGWKPLRAEILQRDPATWMLEFRISRGEKDGVSVGNPVLAGNCLVGRVIETDNESALVATVASPDCRLSAFVQCSGGVSFPCVFFGSSRVDSGTEVECRVDFLPKDATLTPGDMVVSSGMGGQLPYGIPVGILVTDEIGRCPMLIDNARAMSFVMAAADVAHVRFVTVYVPAK
ncbi:MAG: rod shape-determining protein MreC [Victivallales bacterium]|nr:rod shape-determining protein MreC [Victivallales bacterium]